MSEAGVGVSFEIVCPVCGVVQSANAVSTIVKKYLLDDIGRDKVKWTKCESCNKNIALVVRSIKYRVIYS
jgi:predicted RNA-binding Zn-ribbon protein involved in translation (DUF1610 family)